MKRFAAYFGLAAALAGIDVSAAAESFASSPTALPRACGVEHVRVRSGNRTRCVSVWRYLSRRPVRVSSLAPGAPCPTTPPSGDLPILAPGSAGTAFGRGPVYPVLAGALERAEIRFRYPPPRDSIDYGSQWSGQKVMWILALPFRDRLSSADGSSTAQMSCVSSKASSRHASGGCGEVAVTPRPRGSARLAATRTRSTVSASATELCSRRSSSVSRRERPRGTRLPH